MPVVFHAGSSSLTGRAPDFRATTWARRPRRLLVPRGTGTCRVWLVRTSSVQTPAGTVAESCMGRNPSPGHIGRNFYPGARPQRPEIFRGPGQVDRHQSARSCRPEALIYVARRHTCVPLGRHGIAGVLGAGESGHVLVCFVVPSSGANLAIPDRPSGRSPRLLPRRTDWDTGGRSFGFAGADHCARSDRDTRADRRADL
jgi:hypothetical protein